MSAFAPGPLSSDLTGSYTMGSTSACRTASVEGVADSEVEAAVLRSVAYADVFDCPLTRDEIRRFLVGVRVDPNRLSRVVQSMVPARLGRVEGYYFLPGREGLVAHRLGRVRASEALWPSARRWAGRIAALPFVRMVAVTGSLARDHAGPGGDVDYLVVTEPGRLWAARAFVGLLTRWARRRGTVICANYYLSEDALALSERDLYSAQELAQAVPLAGGEIYGRLRRENPWVDDLLPNAPGPECAAPVPEPGGGSLRALAETLLRTPVGAWLDRMERERKRKKSIAQGRDLTEARFEPDCFKGHFDRHGERARTAYAQRLRGLGLSAPHLLEVER